MKIQIITLCLILAISNINCYGYGQLGYGPGIGYGAQGAAAGIGGAAAFNNGIGGYPGVGFPGVGLPGIGYGAGLGLGYGAGLGYGYGG